DATDRRTGRDHGPAARLGLEHRAARCDERDRREQERGAYPRERRRRRGGRSEEPPGARRAPQRRTRVRLDAPALDLTDPPHDPVQDLDRELWLVVQELPERRAEEPEDAHRRLGHDRGGPRAPVDRRELTEEIAGDDRTDASASARHL